MRDREFADASAAVLHGLANAAAQVHLGVQILEGMLKKGTLHGQNATNAVARLQRASESLCDQIRSYRPLLIEFDEGEDRASPVGTGSTCE